MNKTVNINLGGMVFHIDEDAYQKKTTIFWCHKTFFLTHSTRWNIKRHWNARFWIIEWKTNKRQACYRVERSWWMIGMGQPEDYIIEENAGNKTIPKHEQKN
jgi:hypothetical protein